MTFAVLELPYIAGPSGYSNKFSSSRSHPVYAWLGLRPVLAQHTAGEHATLQKWAMGRSNLVEIGVAEGVSAFALRSKMAVDGTLHLIDPFCLRRAPILNFTKRTAHRLVDNCHRGKVEWIEAFSFEAVRKWNRPIDLLFIDGDHSETGVRRDWNEWSRFVVPAGIAIFHDARIFSGGWTTPEWGPVKFVDYIFRQPIVQGWRIVEEIDSLVVVKRAS